MNSIRNFSFLYCLIVVFFFTACSHSKLEEKGFQVNPEATAEEKKDKKNDGIPKDSLVFSTRPCNVLLTGNSNIRLTTIYKVNFNKKEGTSFIGMDNYLYNETELEKGNNWNGNLIPGLEGVYGYNMVNISYYDIHSNVKKDFFDKPVLIKTLYYPSFSKDTLNFKSVQRNYFLISVYDYDSNHDGFINQKDLRHFYLYGINGEKQNSLIPQNYSVYRSEYDSANDFMFVFARLDENNNGRIESNEPIHIFWIDLNNPSKTGRQY